jgi:PASTA domain
MNSLRPDAESEAWARDLMQQAADTIDANPPGTFVATPRARSWWPALAAAVVIVVGTVTIGLGLLDRVGPGPALSTPTRTSASVPSVFGHDAGSARAMLEAEGFEVETEDALVCEPPGRAVGTSPVMGSNVSFGSTITVKVSTISDNTDCFLGERVSWDERSLAWAILDFANGRGPAPEFLDSVELVLDSRFTTARGSDIAAGQEPMATQILQALAADTALKASDDNVALGTTGGPEDQSTCGHRLGQPDYSLAEPLRLTILDSGAAATLTCPALTAHLTHDGRIAGLVLRTGGPSNARLLQAPALSTTYRKCVRSMGLEAWAQVFVSQGGVPQLVKTEPEVPAEIHRPCFQQIGGGLLRPGQSSHDTYELEQTEVSVPSPGWRDLTKYARGVTTEPPVAAEVELYLGGQFMHTLTREQASVEANWEMCAAYAQRSCPMNALTVLAGDGRLVSTGEPQGCLGSLSELPAKLNPTPTGTLSATIQPVGKRACTDNWAVQIWANADGTIRAVNLLLGDP